MYGRSGPTRAKDDIMTTFKPDDLVRIRDIPDISDYLECFEGHKPGDVGTVHSIGGMFEDSVMLDMGSCIMEMDPEWLEAAQPVAI
jgi:hypothetical protein